MIDDKIYDCAVVGGGPAGLSAALYMGRMRRSAIVIDDERGRSTWYQVNRNYLGFPDGIHARSLREVGEEQCRRYRVRFLNARAIDARMEGQGQDTRFYIDTDEGIVVARTVVFATGVKDHFPEFSGSDECIGKSIFWCIICDGYESIGKKIVVLGHNDRAVALALQLKVFTDDVTIISWDEPFNISLADMKRLEEHGVKAYDSTCKEYRCQVGGQLSSIVIEGGTEIPLQMLFVAQWMEPNSQLAKKLGLKLDEHKYILADAEQCTNIDGVYAAGDVTKMFNHQVTSAVHEGGMAAAAANYYLYEDWQKE
jgi:thioredoxin reductase (NADPH)